MTRLEALVAALPKILPVVENITDDLFRDRVFDALVEAATADAAIGDLNAGAISHSEAAARLGYAAATGSEVGTIYGSSAPAENRLLLTPANAASAETPQPGTAYNAIVDVDGRRHTGTYTVDSPTTGTFTPDAASLGFEPISPALLAGGPVNPPSDLPTWDEVNRQHRQP